MKFIFYLRRRLLRTFYGHPLQALGVESIKIQPKKIEQLSKHIIYLYKITKHITVAQLTINCKTTIFLCHTR